MFRGYPLFNRELARYQHRTISLFCAIQCWTNGWDGIRVSRDQLEQLLVLERFKSRRVEWMEEDFLELFPYQHKNYPSFFHSFELSRRAFEERPVIGECIIPERAFVDNIDTLGKQLLPSFSYANNDTERMLIAYLWLLANGRISLNYLSPSSAN